MKRYTRGPSRPELAEGFVVDEFHLLAPPVRRPYSREGAASLIVTQAIVRSKRGKQVFIGSTKTANGQPYPTPPKKFLPVQVLRRQAR